MWDYGERLMIFRSVIDIEAVTLYKILILTLGTPFM